MKIVMGLLLVLLTCASIHASQASDIAYFTHLAKELRLDTKKDQLQEENRIERRSLEILDMIPDFGDVGIDRAVEALMEDVLRVNPDDYQIIDSVKTRLSGKSKARVLFIFDQQKQMQWVVKAFPKPQRPRSGFLAELSGMSLIKERNLSTVMTVKPLGAGKCKEEELEYGLLLETAAPGERADQFIHRITQYAKDDPQREENLKAACRLCMAIGDGLAEFHGVDRKQQAALRNNGLLMTKIEMDQLLTADVIAQLEDQLDVEALKRFVKQKLSLFKMNSARFFRHGDADMKNIFYDTSTNKIIFIDVARIHYFINKSGHPLAKNIDDLFHFYKKMIEEFSEMLSQSEFHQLSLALCQGYTHVDEDVSELSHGKIYQAVSAIAQYSFCDSLADPVERNRQKALLQTYLNFINKFIEED